MHVVGNMQPYRPEYSAVGLSKAEPEANTGVGIGCSVLAEPHGENVVGAAELHVRSRVDDKSHKPDHMGACSIVCAVAGNKRAIHIDRGAHMGSFKFYENLSPRIRIIKGEVFAIPVCTAVHGSVAASARLVDKRVGVVPAM